MRRIKTFNESLYVSDSLKSIINVLIDEYDDKVAYLLNNLRYNDYYADHQNTNYIELSKEASMLNFRPLNRRDRYELDNYKAEKSQTIKVGRLVRNIVQAVKKNLQLTLQTEGVIYETVYGGRRNQFLLIKGKLPIVIKEDKRYQSKITIKIDGKVLKSSFFQLSVSELPLAIFKNKGESTQIQLDDPIDMEPDFIDKDAVGWGPMKYDKLKSVEIPPKKIEIEVESYLLPTDTDIQKFSNRFTAYLNSLGRNDIKMQIVNGEKIRYWYHEKNYQDVSGELGSSCMRGDEFQEVLDIYCSNRKAVSMVIMLSEDGLLIGRALVWKLTDGKYFMDRAYTIIYSDRYLLYDWAKKNGFIYRCQEANEVYLQIGDKKMDLTDYKLEVQLENCDFNFYPFLDTIQYLNKKTGKLTNRVPSRRSSSVIRLSSTEGKFERV
jgi:hypothetical protein